MTRFNEPNLFEYEYQEQKEKDMSEEKKVTISSLELENVKRVKAVKMEPAPSGLTVIGGKNNQGKTSVLDAITFTLGGGDYKPSNVKRDGSMVDPHMRIVLSNGLVAERAGKNSALKVTDPSGNKAGQTLLNSFISQFALDLPKFMNANDKEKARTLLNIIGVGDQLARYDNEEEKLTNERLAIGRIAKEKRGHAEQLPQWDGVPENVISASELIAQQQGILARNGENQRKRNRVQSITYEFNRVSQQVQDLERKLSETKAQYDQLLSDLNIAQTDAKDLVDESTAELERNISEIEVINAKVRDNLAKEKATLEADEYQNRYDALSAQIDEVRTNRLKLLEGAAMPLPGLSIDRGVLIYNGQPWDNMSGSDQLKVSTAIVRKLNPKCGFVLMDKLEQMDLDTLREFGAWLEREGLQAIATRVSTGDECSIYIEDGYSIDHAGNKTAESMLKHADMMAKPEPTLTTPTKWEAGKF